MALPARALVQDADDRRAQARPLLGRAGTLRIAGGPAHEIEVLDLSRDGCRIATTQTLHPNAAVEIGLAHIGLTGGKIVWRGSAGYGCRFDRSLPSGAVTAAFGNSNVVSFASPTSPAEQLTSRKTSLLLVGTGLLTVSASLWYGLASVLLAVMR